jgi:hypothetical protein
VATRGRPVRGFSAVGGLWNIVVAFWKIKGLIGKHAGIYCFAGHRGQFARFVRTRCIRTFYVAAGGCGLERTSLRDLGTQLVFAACDFPCTKASARDTLLRKPGNRVALADGAEGRSLKRTAMGCQLAAVAAEWTAPAVRSAWRRRWKRCSPASRRTDRRPAT